MSDFNEKVKDFLERYEKEKENGNDELAEKIQEEMKLFFRDNPDPEKYKKSENSKENNISSEETKNVEANIFEGKREVTKEYWDNGKLKSETLKNGLNGGIHKTYWSNGTPQSEIIGNGITNIVKKFNEDGKLISQKQETPTTKLEKNDKGDVKLEVKDDKTLATDALKKIEQEKEPLKQFCKENNLDFNFVNNCDKKRMDYHLKVGKMYNNQNGSVVSEDLKNIKDFGKELSPEKKKEFDAIYRDYELKTIMILRDGKENPTFRKNIEERADGVRQEEVNKQKTTDNRPKEEKALDEMIASGGYSVEELDIALDIGIEDEKNRLQSQSKNNDGKQQVSQVTKQGVQNQPKTTNINPNILAAKNSKSM